MIEKGEWLLPSKKRKKKSKNKIHWFGPCWEWLNQLLLSLGCWLMLARRFCVYNVGLKVHAAQEILTVIMMSNDKNICTFCFWRSLYPFLASRLTTVSLDHGTKIQSQRNPHVMFSICQLCLLFLYHCLESKLFFFSCN